MTAAILAASVPVLPARAVDGEVPQRLEEYQPEAFAQNGPLDRLKKRSAKRRWNDIRREDRSARRDRDDELRDKLDGNPAEPVPVPYDDATEPESPVATDVTDQTVAPSREAIGRSSDGRQDDEPFESRDEVPSFAEPTTSPRTAPESDSTRTAPRDSIRIPVSSRTQIAEETPPSPTPEPNPVAEDFPVPEPDVTQALPSEPFSDVYGEPVNTPAELKSITEIMPFRSYEPDKILAAEDPCNNLCPRPDGFPCVPPPGQIVPECPEEFRLGGEAFAGRMFEASCFMWESSNLFYHPLYFEDPKLERYGHTYHDVVQPFASVGRFGVQLVGLPYQMVIDNPCRKVYPLGYYRPGDCAPKQIKQIPWNLRAALFQAEVVAGAIILFP